MLVLLEGEAASSVIQGSSSWGCGQGAVPPDTGVLDYHRQFCRHVHEDMVVDEPWDALKGEVGPVLASVAPSPGERERAREKEGPAEASDCGPKGAFCCC